MQNQPFTTHLQQVAEDFKDSNTRALRDNLMATMDLSVLATHVLDQQKQEVAAAAAAAAQGQSQGGEEETAPTKA
jgi:hypothetical protein